MDYPVVGIVGSGTMGRGIAVAVATSGRKVLLSDISQDVLNAAIEQIAAMLQASVERHKLEAGQKSEILERILLTVDIGALSEVAVVVEAAPESMELKRKIFSDLAIHCDEDAIFATNTSSLLITSIAAQVPNPRRFAGMHFFNPAHIMKLVEVVKGRFTSDETMTVLCDFAEKIGKIPVRVKDTPGFIVNRVARSFYTESLRILEEQVADAETIDKIVTSHGFKMGPFKLMDLIGNDINLEVTQSLYYAYHGEPRYRPSQIQSALVDAGMLGRKTGQGFYDYTK
jgi:3-hydroxybutyryl-CoA dehydrogenase